MHIQCRMKEYCLKTWFTTCTMLWECTAGLFMCSITCAAASVNFVLSHGRGVVHTHTHTHTYIHIHVHMNTHTSCVCNYRCLNKRHGVDILKDDMCMSGVGTIRLRSKIRESQILYLSYVNEVSAYECGIGVSGCVCLLWWHLFGKL